MYLGTCWKAIHCSFQGGLLLLHVRLEFLCAISHVFYRLITWPVIIKGESRIAGGPQFGNVRFQRPFVSVLFWSWRRDNLLCLIQFIDWLFCSKYIHTCTDEQGRQVHIISSREEKAPPKIINNPTRTTVLLLACISGYDKHQVHVHVINDMYKQTVIITIPQGVIFHHACTFQTPLLVNSAKWKGASMILLYLIKHIYSATIFKTTC